MTPISSTRLDDANDTEITLGTGKMLGIFFGLVILCAVFFGMGFSMGRNSVRSAPELLPSPSTSSGNRPSASAGKPSEQPQTSTTAESKPAQTTPDNSASNSSQSLTSPDQSAPQGALPAGAGYFVQVAAVSKQEDAEALVESLKGRQYSAFIVNPSPDKFFHVQVGPFSDIKEAENIRAKLVSDGYNPILKK